jgi:hypothetical protein
MVHVALPKQPINQFELFQPSRQFALRAYCPNIYTVIQIVAAATCCCKGSFKNYVEKMRGIGGQKYQLLATFRMNNVHVEVGSCPKRAKLGQCF